MELRPGFKQTELGAFPSDWECRDLGSLDPFVTSGSRGWAAFYANFGSAFVRITNMSRESIYLDLSDLKCVVLPPQSSEGTRTALQPGDLIVSITADIGIVSYIDGSVPVPAYINQHVALVRFADHQVDRKYLAYFLAAEASQRAFRSSTDQGAKAGMNLAAVRKVRTVLPPASEQRAIAAALSNVDVLLAKLDQLIAKKRGLKQAAMQQLLTGQTRLPGFSVPWPPARLGKIGQFAKGRGLSKEVLSESGALAAIPYTAIFTDFDEVIGVADIQNFVAPQLAEVVIDSPRLLIASSSNMLANIGKATAYIDTRHVAVGGDVLIYESSVDVRFLAYLLSTESHRRRVVALSQGSTIRHVYASTFSAYEIDLPPRAEQTAIATLLSDIDAELAALTARRDKTHAIKQGMMQELLTGRIRLV